MTSLVRFAVFTCGAFSAVSVARSAMIYDINLYNASGRSVELMFRRTGGKWAHWATIPPNRAKTFSYYGGVALRWSGQQHIYSRVDPPADYISAGLFSVSFKAQLASDLNIYLLPPSVAPPASHLPPQPKGFPLRATNGSSQAMRRAAGRPNGQLMIVTTSYSQPRALQPAVADLGSR